MDTKYDCLTSMDAKGGKIYQFLETSINYQ